MAKPRLNEDTRTSKVLDIKFNNQYTGNKGSTIYTYNILFENGDAAEFTTNKVQMVDGKLVQSKFAKDQSYTYNFWEEEIPKKAGGTFLKKRCDIYRPPYTGGGGGGGGGNYADQDSIIRIVSLNAAIEYCAYMETISREDVLDVMQIASTFETLIHKLIKQNTAEGKQPERSVSINAQSALKSTMLMIQKAHENLNAEFLETMYPLGAPFRTFYLKCFNYVVKGETTHVQ